MAAAKFCKFMGAGTTGDAKPIIMQEHREILQVMTQALEAGITAAAEVLSSRIDELWQEVAALKEKVLASKDDRELSSSKWRNRAEQPSACSAVTAASSRCRRNRAKRTKKRMWEEC